MASDLSTKPAAIRKDEAAGEVIIEWKDGHTCRIAMEALREECPCAVCQGESGMGNPNRPPTPPEGNRLARIDLVGRYAVRFLWADGHDTGIYSFAYLRSLCPCPQA